MHVYVCMCTSVCVSVNASLPAGQSFGAVLMELLIIEEQGLIEKINIPQSCNEFHVEEQARYKLPVRATRTHRYTHLNSTFPLTEIMISMESQYYHGLIPLEASICTMLVLCGPSASFRC